MCVCYMREVFTWVIQFNVVYYISTTRPCVGQLIAFMQHIQLFVTTDFECNARYEHEDIMYEGQ